MIEVRIGEAASYAAAGVDIHAGDEFSRMWFDATVATHGNRAGLLGQLALSSDGFAGARGFDMDLIQGQYGLVLTGGVDGAGTKPEGNERTHYLQFVSDVQERFRNHAGVSHDVIAMCVDDLARDGFEPFGMFILYDTNSLKKDDAKTVTAQLTAGMVTGSKSANVVFLNGESAELGDRVNGYSDFNYNLGGFAIGMGHRSRIIDGKKVQPGDVIMAIRTNDEEGRSFRSNGFSLVRRVLEAEYGMEWHHAIGTGENPLINDIFRPSTIFSRVLVAMHGGYDLNRDPRVKDIHGIVHVTGGGVPGKLQRLLAATGLGAHIDEPYVPIDAMKEIQAMSLKHNKLATPDASAYQSLNMALEALVVVPESEVGAVARTAADDDKEAKPIGVITKKPGIVIKSEGVSDPGELIHFIPVAA